MSENRRQILYWRLLARLFEDRERRAGRELRARRNARELLQLEGEAHVAFDFEFAAEEQRLSVGSTFE